MIDTTATTIEGAFEYTLSKTSGPGGSGFSLRIREMRSRLLVFEAKLTATQLGEILGSSPVAVEGGRLWASPLHGKYHHSDQVRVWIPTRYARLTRTFNTDGFDRHVRASMADAGWDSAWEPERVERFNSHRRGNVDGEGVYAVTVRAYTDDPEPPPVGQKVILRVPESAR